MYARKRKRTERKSGTLRCLTTRTVAIATFIYRFLILQIFLEDFF